MRRLRFRSSGMFTLKDEFGRGRCVMLTSSIITMINQWLTANIFYTSFLMIYGIDLVNIGIITFIPYIAGCFGIFAPSILERFEKRRWVLAGGRMIFSTLNILGITLVPVLVHDQGTRIICFVVIIFLANLANALTGSGYSVWHLNFIPDQIRAEYFLKQSIIGNFIGIGCSVVCGIIADALSGSPYADTIIIAFRYLAYVLALIEIVVLALPKEYPYPKTAARPKLRDIIVLPLKSKPFMLSMAVVLLHTVSCNIPAASLNYYLLNDVGIKYTTIYLVNLVYPLVILICQPFCRRLIARYGWFMVFAVSILIHMPTMLPYSMVNASNYAWLFPLIRITQHFCGVGINTAFANLQFVNLPPKDQTNYISFHALINNISMFLGMMFGTVLIAWIGDRTVFFLGMHFTSVQILLWIQGIGQIITPAFVFLFIRTLDPDRREKLALSK